MSESSACTAAEAASAAASTFRLFEDGAPQLIPFGWKGIDRVLGGSVKTELSVFAGMNGLAKSRCALTACMTAGDGLLSLEDGKEDLGARYIAAKTGIDSRRIRLKDLTPAELRRIRSVVEGKDPMAPKFHVAVGAGLQEACDGIKALADMGCRRVWFDYLQKVRGCHDERRHEVGLVMTTAHRTAAQAGVALTLISQFKRVLIPHPGGRLMIEATKYDRPQRSWLKESGDIENEARVIMFVWAAERGRAELLIEVDKASYGGEGTQTTMRPDASGTLREVLDADRL